MTSVVAGSTVAYTITVANAGPSTAVGAHVVDTVPSTLSGASWTCVGTSGGVCTTGSGTDSIDTTVDLPVGGVATFTLTATLSASATGALVNTATVDAAAGTIDPVPGNNSATDTDTVVVSSDLSVVKSDGVSTATPGGSVELHDHGHQRRAVDRHRSVRVTDTLPASLADATWTCAAVLPRQLSTATNGSGSIDPQPSISCRPDPRHVHVDGDDRSGGDWDVGQHGLGHGRRGDDRSGSCRQLGH